MQIESCLTKHQTLLLHAKTDIICVTGPVHTKRMGKGQFELRIKREYRPVESQLGPWGRCSGAKTRGDNSSTEITFSTPV